MTIAKRALAVIACLLALMASGSPAIAASVPAEAQRYMLRGTEAVEMARKPADFAAAITEFSQAARLAPDWPDPYYNMGMVHHRLEKFEEAERNLKRYLELAPNAPDAAEVRTLLVKIEYRKERAQQARMDPANLVGTWETDKENGGDFYRFRVANSQGRVVAGLLPYAFTEQRGLANAPTMVPVKWDGTTLLIAKTHYFYCDRSVRLDSCPAEATLTLTLTAPDTLQGTLHIARDHTFPGSTETSQRRVWRKTR